MSTNRKTSVGGPEINPYSDPVGYLAWHRDRAQSRRPAPHRQRPPGRPYHHYQAAGHRSPAGTPKQTAWAVRIKGSLWSRLPAAVTRLCLDPEHGQYGHVLVFLARAGHDRSVVPLLRAAHTVWALDRLDAEDAKFWIEGVELYRRRAMWVVGDRWGYSGWSRPLTLNEKAERAVSRSLSGEGAWFFDYLVGRPTPADWQDDLDDRGLTYDPGAPLADWENAIFLRHGTACRDLARSHGPGRDRPQDHR